MYPTMLTIFLLIFITRVLCEGPIITLPDGKIEGLSSTTIRNKLPFYAYLGIPFAAPPVGNLRMKPPQPVKTWNNTLSAKSNRKICYQISPKIHYPQYEDCLILNVYTSIKPEEINKLPVLVSIYGGSFTHGYATFGTVGPDYLLEEGIVVVTFNYRVGPFGFLSTGDDLIPGNMGIKDQVFALKWVQKNIHLFGGDPSKVTIQGQSAGAASVTYHILSPQSAGLFRAAIANSGSALNIWANMNNSAPNVAKRVAQLIEPSLKDDSSSQEIHDVLMKADAEAIHATGSKYSAYAPVLESNHNGAFLTESMYGLLTSGKFSKVPLLIGFNSEEYISLAANENGLITSAKTYDNNVASLVCKSFNISDSATLKKVGGTIKTVYTHDKDFEHEHGAVIRFKSDDMFVRGVLRYAQMQAVFTDVYLYEFSYHGILGRNNLTYEGCGRVEHGEEGRYLWAGTDLNTVPQSDVTTVDRYVGFLANFVKYLNPTPNKDDLFQNIIWPKLSYDKIGYMNIDEKLAIKHHPRNGSYEKWVAIFDKYAVQPILTY